MPGALFTGPKGSFLLRKNKPLAAGAYAAYQIHVLRGFILILIVAFSAGAVWAGGSGLNVVVVVNQNSPKCLQLGND